MSDIDCTNLKNIDTQEIYDAHRKILQIVNDFNLAQVKVSTITIAVKQNWVGAGRDAFETQYNLLIKKIEDFGDTVQDIYDALVNAEVDYETTDDNLRQDFAMAMPEEK